ncbi:hypothetical protein FOL46_003658, partial [Perkinsus olseni]
MDCEGVGLKGMASDLGTPQGTSSTLHTIGNITMESPYGGTDVQSEDTQSVSIRGRMELGTTPMTADERPYVWLPRFGIMLKELLEGPECQDIQDGMSMVLESSEAPEGEAEQATQGKPKDLPSEYPCPDSIEITACLPARAHAGMVDVSDTGDMEEEGVKGGPCMLPSTHKGTVCSEGLAFRVIPDADCRSGHQHPHSLPRFGEERVRKELALLYKGA